MADSKKQLKVNDPDAHYEAMKDDRRLVRTVHGGTRAMRAAKQEYLPQEQGETVNEYEARLKRSYCYPGVENAVDDIIGRVFRNPVQIDMAAFPLFAALELDANLCGDNLHRFARDVAQDALLDGVCYVLVDMPRVAAANLAEQRQAGARPFFRKITALDMIGLRTGRRAGVEAVMQARIHETHTEETGEFGETCYEQIRVIDAPAEDVPGSRCTYRIYRKVDETKSDDWTLVEEGVIDSEYIPLVAVYSDKRAFMRGCPPLRNLAWINVAHWQSSSDQRNILRIGRVPIIVASGVREEEIAPNGKATVGSSRIWAFSNDAASVRYVEHGGAAIKAGAEDLAQLESQMKAMAAELQEKPGDRTATEAAIQTAQDNSWLTDFAHGIKDSLNQAFVYAADWLGIARTEAPTVSMELSATGDADKGDMAFIDKARDRGDLTRETYLREMERRNLFSDEFDAEEEARKAFAEEDREPDMSGTGIKPKVEETDDEEEDEDEDGMGEGDGETE